jgi:hypothetical protein
VEVARQLQQLLSDFFWAVVVALYLAHSLSIKPRQLIGDVFSGFFLIAERPSSQLLSDCSRLLKSINPFAASKSSFHALLNAFCFSKTPTASS